MKFQSHSSGKLLGAKGFRAVELELQALALACCCTLLGGIYAGPHKPRWKPLTSGRDRHLEVLLCSGQKPPNQLTAGHYP